MVAGRAHFTIALGGCDDASKGRNSLDVLNVRQVPTRCADNRLWAIADNSSQPYSHWRSFVAWPDAIIAKQLAVNEPGMLVHDFPDALSEGGWRPRAMEQRYIDGRPGRARDEQPTRLQSSW